MKWEERNRGERGPLGELGDTAHAGIGNFGDAGVAGCFHGVANGAGERGGGTPAVWTT